MISMKQKSPELEIPEGIFYDGIPNCNIYVQKKDLKTGKLYGLMIYRMTASYEDAAIILADSGMIQSTAEKKHLLLHLWSGEWFENMQSQELGNSAAVPYRRETFTTKKILIDFDSDFNMTDASSLSNNARGKSLADLRTDLDSLNQSYDSIGRAYYRDEQMMYYQQGKISKQDSLHAENWAMAKSTNYDSLFNKAQANVKAQAINQALATVQSEMSDLEFKSMITSDGDKIIRLHKIEMINKFTTALICIVFFFIGAPLGAIIRKGGLGIPVILSVLIYIIYYILDNTGYRMARQGIWAIWFGKSMALAVLIPLAVFVTYKANNDSVIFNMDIYRNLFRKLFGLRLHRHIFGKEVIINDPEYHQDADELRQISTDVRAYSREHNLKKAPNIIKVFFKYQPDHEIERIDKEMEEVIEDLSNTKDKIILHLLNDYPVLSTKAHTRPFERRWMNIVSFLILPVGWFLYFRMWRFRLRLHHDLTIIDRTNQSIRSRIRTMDEIKAKAEHKETPEKKNAPTIN